MPSEDVVFHANENKGGEAGDGKNKGKLTIVLANLTKSGWTPRPKFREYQDAFEALRKKPRRISSKKAPMTIVGTNT